ncbi:MAG: HAD hydrolase-like protein [Erysipelotrichaceae bacterium]
MNMLKYLIWDFNGTILDDVDLCLSILNNQLTKYHLPNVSKDHYLDIFTFPIVDYYLAVGLNDDIKPFEQLANEFIEQYDQRHKKETVVYPQVLELLKKYQKLGFKQIVLSASKQDILVDQLRYFNVDQYFDEILGINDIYAHSKLELGLNWIKEQNINLDEALMIGDSIHDLEVGLSMGVNVVLVGQGHTSMSRLLAVSANSFNDFCDVDEYVMNNFD